MKKLILLSAILLLPSCKTDSPIDADRIAPLVKIVCARHDAYVNADPSLAPEIKTFYLNSSRELLELMDKAQNGMIDGVPVPVAIPAE